MVYKDRVHSKGLVGDSPHASKESRLALRFTAWYPAKQQETIFKLSMEGTASPILLTGRGEGGESGLILT